MRAACLVDIHHCSALFRYDVASPSPEVFHAKGILDTSQSFNSECVINHLLFVVRDLLLAFLDNTNIELEGIDIQFRRIQLVYVWSILYISWPGICWIWYM